MRRALQSTNARGNAVDFKVNVVGEMARVMGLTVAEFNDTFRDAKTPLGQRFADVWRTYRERHLQPAARTGTARARSDGLAKVLDHIAGAFGSDVLQQD